MPKFDQDSFSLLSQCHQDLQVLFYDAIKNIEFKIYRIARDESLEPARKGSIDGVHGLPLMWLCGYLVGMTQKLKDEGKMTESFDCYVNYVTNLINFELI